MNLNNLKPAWRRFRLVNSMRLVNQEEILLMLESAEDIAASKSSGLPMHILLFTLLTFCCQGG